MMDPAPDCIILDLMLPDGDGAVILRKVREDKFPTCVVVTTGCTDRERLDEVEQLRPERLLRKPVDFSQVLSGCR